MTCSPETRARFVCIYSPQLTGEALCATKKASAAKTASKTALPSPFLVALNAGNLDVCKSLIDEKPELLKTMGASGFLTCLDKGYNKLATYLCQQAAFPLNDEEKNPLAMTIIYGEKELANLLIARGANPNFVDKKHRNLLNLCLIRDFYDLAEALLKAGAEINARDDKGWSLLMLAASRNQLQAVEFLLANGASLHLTSPEGWNALTVATIKDFKSIQQKLLLSGGTIPERFKQEMLIVLYKQGDMNTLTRFVKEGIDVNTIDADKETLLTLACRDNQPDLVALLLQHGARQVLDTAETPLNLAIKNAPGTELLALLLEQNPYPHLKDALWTACGDQRVDCVELLLQHSDCINARHRSGHTLLHYAAKLESEQLIVLLLKHGANKFSQNDMGYLALNYTKNNLLKSKLS